MANILLQHTAINSGTAVRILADKVTVSGRKNNTANPDANGTDHTEVQTNTFENLKYSINNIHLTGESGTLTYTDILKLYKAKYNGSNAALLTITYGTNNIVPNLTEATSGIKVILNDFSVPFDARATRDAYLPIASLDFTETK